MTRKAVFEESFWKVFPLRPWFALRAATSGRKSNRSKKLIEMADLDLGSLPDSPPSLALKHLFRQLRPYQWAKNLLLFLPLVASHEDDLSKWFWTFMAFVTFSLLASSVYIVNDLLDLEADRAHPTKSNRPLAKGDLSIKVAIRSLILLLVLSVIGAIYVGPYFALVALTYLCLTTLYSFGLKSVYLVDIVMLAGLFSIRVVAGAAAAEVPASIWFLAFVAPVFLSLATVKRLTEVTKLDVEGRVPGRAYARSDRNWLLALSAVSAVTSVAVFVAYGYSPAAADLYDKLWLFQLASVPLVFWFYRMISTSWNGTQSYDPMSFAFRDLIGLSFAFCAGVLAVLSI